MPPGASRAAGRDGGLRIGRDGDGYAVKGMLPGRSAERAGLRLGDRVLSVGGRRYGGERVNFRDLFLRLRRKSAAVLGGSGLEARGGRRDAKTSPFRRAKPDEPGDALVWKSARVLRRGGKQYGYARLWGMSAETALAVVDLLLDRDGGGAGAARSSRGWTRSRVFSWTCAGNSGGYDPNILTTFLRGRWSARDY